MAKKAKQLKITLTKSVIGSKPKNRATIEALGLRKMAQSVVKPDTPVVRGMLLNIQHLIQVEEINS